MNVYRYVVKLGGSVPLRGYGRGNISCRDVRTARLYMKFRAHTPLPPHAGAAAPATPPRGDEISVNAHAGGAKKKGSWRGSYAR